MKEFNLLIWLAQLGISVAVPLTVCIWGAAWLRNRFALGPWVMLIGIMRTLSGQRIWSGPLAGGIRQRSISGK